MILIKHIPNALSKEGRTAWEADAASHMLSDYIPQEFDEGHRVIHSRHGIVHRDKWDEITVRDGDEIIITPDVEIIAGLIAAFMWLGASTALATFLAYAVVTVFWVAMAGMAVYSVVQARKFKGGNDSGSWEESPTYGWDGARTMADTELPVPVIYGKVQTGGNIISSYVEAVDDNHYLNTVIALGEGPVESIGGITSDTDNADVSAIGDAISINGNPIDNYQDVQVFVRMGDDVQDIIPGFDLVQEEFDLSASQINLKKDAPYTYTTTNDDVDSAVVNFQLPDGLYRYKANSMRYKTWWVFYRVEYKLHSDVVYTEVTQTYPRSDSTGLPRHPYINYIGGGYGAQASGTTYPETMPTGDGAIYAKTTSTLRRSLVIEFPGPGKYDIRLTRTSANSTSGGTPKTGANTFTGNLYVQTINERRNLTLTYPYTALLGLRVLATEQLSGSFPTVLTEVEGLKATDWNGSAAYTQNPMKCMWDLLTNERYGAGLYIEPSNMDADLAQEVSDYCDEQVFLDGVSGPEEDRFHLDVVLDSFRRAMDVIVDLASSFRAIPFYSAGAVKILCDKPEVPVQTFGMGSIIEHSFTENFVSLKNRKNRTQIQFLDSARQYQRDTVEEVDEDSLDAGEPIRDSTMFMPGITRQSQAMRIARFMLKLNILSTRTIIFRAAVEAVTMQVGDVFNFAHDVPQWGLHSGRVKSGTASTFTVKENVTIPTPPSGSTVVVQMRHSDDSIEEQDITSAPGDYAAGDTLSIAPATFDTNPAEYDVFVIGYDTTVTKPFRVYEMSREEDFEVKIVGVEYDEDIYDESNLLPPADQFTYLPDPRRLPLPVENLTATQNRGQNPNVTISFDIPEVDADYGFWDHGEIWLGEFDEDDGDDTSGGPDFELVGRSRSEPYTIYDLTPGRPYRVRVVSVSKWGVRENPADAATVDFIHGFTYVAPPIVRGLEIIAQGNDEEFKSADAVFEWRPARSFESANNPVGTEPLGAGQGTEDYWFRDYKVEIITRNAVRRTVFVKDPMFTYTRNMNYEDNKDFHTTSYLQSPVAKLVAIRVWVRDIFNQESSRPAILIVSNDAPAPIGGWELAVVAPVTSADYFFTLTDLEGGRMRLEWPQSQEADIAGYRIHKRTNAEVPMDATDGQPTDDTYLYLDSTENSIVEQIANVGDIEYYVIAPYDTFRRDLINYRRKVNVERATGDALTLTEDVIWPQYQEPDIPRY